MLDLNNRMELCIICKHEITSIHIEVKPGFKIYVCEKCLEAARHNFIWVCLRCGKSYMRPKELVKYRLNGSRPKNSFIFSEDVQLIQGLEMCIACNPKGIMEYMEKQKARAC